MSERRRGWHWRERPVTFVWVVLQFPGELWRSVHGYVSFPRSLVAERSSGVSNVLYRLGWWGPGDACASLCPRPGGVGPMAAAVATHRVRPAPFTPPSPASRSRRKGLPPGGRSCEPTARLVSPCVPRGPNWSWTGCWFKSGATRRRSSWRVASQRTTWPGYSPTIRRCRPAAVVRGRHSLTDDTTEMLIRRVPEERR